jgi:hypothetical protein
MYSVEKKQLARSSTPAVVKLPPVPTRISVLKNQLESQDKTSSCFLCTRFFLYKFPLETLLTIKYNNYSSDCSVYAMHLA